jgi:hypothetical protein
MKAEEWANLCPHMLLFVEYSRVNKVHMYGEGPAWIQCDVCRLKLELPDCTVGDEPFKGV